MASFDAHILRTAGLELLSLLWAHDVSAELARDARSPDELVSRNRDESYSWIIMLKQDSMLKIRTMDRKDVADVELPNSQLLNWLRAAIRERTSRQTTSSLRGPDNALSLGTSTHGPDGGVGGMAMPNTEQEVKVLIAGTRSKKSNRRIIIEQAQANAASLLHSFLDGPIAAVETSDMVLELIQETALSEPETWRRAEQSVDKNERKYVQEIHDMLASWRTAWEAGHGADRHAFVYNFRTTKCIYYDLGA